MTAIPPVARTRLPPSAMRTFLDSAGVTRRIERFARESVVFAQGDLASSVFCIEDGGVKLSVQSNSGREAVVGMLAPGGFFGEGCLAGQSLRTGTATAMVPTTAWWIDKREMMHRLRERSALADRFVAHLLARNIQIEEDLLNQLFDSSEKRLARALLLLARYGGSLVPQPVLPNLSRQTLARMAGTTRAQVSMIMTRFRKLGFITDDGALTINSSLLSVVLRD